MTHLVFFSIFSILFFSTALHATSPSSPQARIICKRLLVSSGLDSDEDEVMLPPLEGPDFGDDLQIIPPQALALVTVEYKERLRIASAILVTTLARIHRTIFDPRVKSTQVGKAFRLRDRERRAARNDWEKARRNLLPPKDACSPQAYKRLAVSLSSAL